MNRLSFWCLTLLGLTPLLGAVELGFWQVLRLLAVVVGLAWLLWRQHRGERMPWGWLVVPLVYLFVLTQFVQGAENGWLLLCSLLFIGLALVGVSRELLPLSKLDRWVIAVGGLAVAASLATQLVLGPASGQLRSERWWSSVYLLELLLVYLAVSRLLRGPQEREQRFRLLAVTGGAFLFAGLGGAWQIGAAIYHSGQAKADFAAGRYDQAAAHVASLQPQDQGLAFGPLGMEHTVEQLSTMPKGADAWMALGDIASQEELWYTAQQAYQQVYQQQPSYPSVCARLGLSLFELAKTDSALLLLHQGVAQRDAGVEEHLALAIVLARTAAWTETGQALGSALELSGLIPELRHRLEEGKLNEPLRELLSPLFQRYARRLSLFEVVQVLESSGWKVLHPAMDIGQTGLKAPVDISAYSGGGSLFGKEDIVVKGTSISLRNRGYNLAVITPQAGEVDTVAWFDQSNTRAVAGFLSSVPEGYIVALSAREDIAMSMTAEVREELGRLGADRGVGYGWSYALIGVRGVKRGEGVERRSDRSLVVAGVLGANIPEAVAANPAQLEAALRDAASKAPAGIAVYLPSLEPEARLVAVQR